MCQQKTLIKQPKDSVDRPLVRHITCTSSKLSDYESHTTNQSQHRAEDKHNTSDHMTARP